MSIAVINSVFDRSQARGVARLVLLAIADRADDNGRAFPGTAELCRRCNASRDSIIEARKELQRIGELVIEDQGGSNGERRSHRYLITLPQPVGNSDQSENATGRNLPPTSRKFRLEPVGNSDPNHQKPSENHQREVKRSAFTPPTIEEARGYGTTINLPDSEAENFVDHFQANGWKISGKTPMRDWQAAMRTWKRRAIQFGRIAPEQQSKPEPRQAAVDRNIDPKVFAAYLAAEYPRETWTPATAPERIIKKFHSQNS